MNAPTSPEYFIVLDTNVWVYKTLLLRSPLGASLLHLLQTRPGAIGLPDVVRHEIVKNARKHGMEGVQWIEDGLGRLRLLTGSAMPLTLPTAAELETYAQRRLDDLASFLIPLTSSFDQYKAALSRVMNETSPNAEGNQQYKDSLLWESVLELARRGPVYFVSHDGGFFAEGKKGENKALAKSLDDEVKAAGLTVVAYNDLATLLKALRQTAPSFDPKSFVPAISSLTSSVFEEYEAKHHLQLSGPEACMDEHHFSAFLTERPDILAIEFRLFRPATAPAESDRAAVSGYVVVAGGCFANLKSRAAFDLKLDVVQLVDSDGNRIEEFGRFLYMSAEVGMFGANRNAMYSFRYPIKP